MALVPPTPLTGVLSPPQTPFRYGFAEDTFLKKTAIIVGQIALAAIAVGFFVYSPGIFLTCVFIGIALSGPLATVFNKFENISKISKAAFFVFVVIAAAFAFPTSAVLACALMGMWVGKRLTDISYSPNCWPSKDSLPAPART